MDLFTAEPVSLAENVKKLAQLPLHHHPGDRFTYSEGLDVLSYFIEIISAQTFAVVSDQGPARGGLGSAGTFDWGGYFNTQYFADPQEGLIGILMKQTQGAADDTAWRFRLLVGQAVDD